ncbi:alkanesulfonate transporter permease [Paenibacillus sp. 32O-W]|jgi:ABC-type nitrate/sulfonate/bicarbonate transport system permease component|uniref:Sulfonate ABC transporter n=1 Tax=Paenibacillus cisolokensis TaxID=1658519 RepID=A0ABQ4N723_9BACL|nr:MULTISPECIES: ABC transporter permease subunit [Paenibacillus]ALS25817.1 alkanesulfonate transporter permease [Paenibacillus sp. 32O-W]GIQ63964.1 sulfonate ABC transporter [Paenibacillus cisolokensis]
MKPKSRQNRPERRHWAADVLLPWLVPLLIVAAWQIASSLEFVSAKLFPTPLMIVEAGWKLLSSGQLAHHMGISLQRALIGLLIGGGIGFLFGIANAIFKTSYRLFDTTIQMIRNIPHLALVPLVIIWIGIGETSKVFLVAVGVLFPIYVNTYHGIRNVSGDYVEMGSVYGLKPREIFFHILLPGALPSIFVGLRYALGVMWLTLIVAETIATNEGIGYLAMNAREFMQADVIILSIILYALFGKLADIAAKLLERRLLRWHTAYQS